MIAIDTNLLVYAHRSGTAEHRAAQEAIERAARGPGGFGFALASICEFWSVVTHRASSGRPSTAREAAGFIEALVVDGRAEVFTPGAGFADRLLELAEQIDLEGARIFDLQIGLAALEAGAAEIWTHDRRFTELPGLAVRDPLRKQ